MAPGCGNTISCHFIRKAEIIFDNCRYRFLNLTPRGVWQDGVRSLAGAARRFLGCPRAHCRFASDRARRRNHSPARRLR